MTIISKDKAQEICSVWHNGFGCALYQFASSKTYIDANYEAYMRGITMCNPHPIHKKTLKELTDFFIYKHKEANS